MAWGRSRTGPVTPDEQTIRLARKRFARRQWSRRWLLWRRILLAVLLLVTLSGAGWLVLFSPTLAVAHVRVAGTSVLDPREVRQVAAVPRGEPLARVNVDAIAARVEGLAPVGAVDVSRAWPDTVRIAISERVAVAVVERDGVVRGLDVEGVIFRSYPFQPEHLPLIRMSASTRSEALAEGAAVIDALPGDLAARVEYLQVETVDSITLRLRGGRTVFWGSADESANKAEVLAVLLRQKATEYDVSVPGQPTIRR
jgi:cell division protein FtsQ